MVRMIFKVIYNTCRVLVKNVQIFDKSTDRIANENVELGQYEANDYWELEQMRRMKVQVIYNRV